MKNFKIILIYLPRDIEISDIIIGLEDQANFRRFYKYLNLIYIGQKKNKEYEKSCFEMQTLRNLSSTLINKMYQNNPRIRRTEKVSDNLSCGQRINAPRVIDIFRRNAQIKFFLIVSLLHSHKSSLSCRPLL